MQFEGSFHIDAPPTAAWQTLTDTAVLARITPHIEQYNIIEPDKRFAADATLAVGGQSIPLSADIHWLDLIPNEYLHTLTKTSWMGQKIKLDAKIWLIAAVQTEVRFSAELTAPAIPKSIAHAVMSGILRDFFTNFKQELKEVESIK